MIGRKLLLAAVCGAVLAPGMVLGQNLLENPGLEFTTNTFYHSVPSGWKMDEGPAVPWNPNNYNLWGDYNNSGVPAGGCQPNAYCNAVDAADYTVWRDNLGKTQAGDGYTLPNENATFGNVSQADYNQWKLWFAYPPALSLAEPTNFPNTLFEGDWNMWFQPYQGTFFEAEDNYAHLYQDVAGTPGTTYTMKGWAAFEPFFAGARANLNLEGSGATPPDDGLPSPTKAIFALEFLDSGGSLLSGSIEKDLRTNGQVISAPGASFLTYTEHMLSAVAPAGTVKVRVRASMIDGVLNPGVDPQSYFVDAFELTASAGAASTVPEPASLLSISIVVAAALLVQRRLR
jgi:hypothetical protein